MIYFLIKKQITYPTPFQKSLITSFTMRQKAKRVNKILNFSEGISIFLSTVSLRLNIGDVETGSHRQILTQPTNYPPFLSLSAIFLGTFTLLKALNIILLLLSHFSHVRLCATPQTAAHQAPPSLGFSRQEHWSGLPFPSSMHESEK